MHQQSANMVDDSALISVLCRLHEWETERASILRCATGRQLYFAIAQSALMEGVGPMVKEVITAKHITGRALRGRLRLLAKQGYVHVVPSIKADRRIKVIKPSPELSAQLRSHLSMFRQILQDHYFLIERESVHPKSDAIRPRANS